VTFSDPAALPAAAMRDDGGQVPVRPDVCVVVIVYNDRDLLPAAVRSAMSQTLRNIEIIVVDHGSNDGTAEVADQLANEDDRVKVVHLPDNVGGPGRPCNVGIDTATAPYVTIVGSDDELTSDACRLMFSAAEQHGADLVLGKPVQIHVHQRSRARVWQATLYREDAVYAGVREHTRLMWDQISASKLYSVDLIRRHRIRFPEDLIYEDQFFTLACYVFAQRIAVVSETVYRWMIRGKTAKPSITQTRSSIANLRDRLAVNVRMDEFLRDNDADDLAPVKDAKFLVHDLGLYLRDLWMRPLDYQRTFLELVGRYVATIPFSVIEQLRPIHRVAAYMLVHRDLEGLLAAWDFIRDPGRVSIDLTVIGDRVYWGHRHLGGSDDAKPWLDVTELGLHKTPFSQQVLYNWLTSYGVQRSTLRVDGEFFNQLGQIGADDEVHLALVLRERARAVGGAARELRSPVEVIRVDDQRVTYEAELALGAILPSKGRIGDTWDFYLDARWNGQSNSTRVSSRDPDVTPVPVPVRPRIAGVSGDALAPVVSAEGYLSLRLVGSTPGRHRAGLAVRKGFARLKRMRSAAVGVPGGRRRLWFYRNVFMKLPIKAGLVYFEAFQGKQASDSPRAIYELVRETHPELDLVWGRSRSPWAAGFPAGSRVVQRGSWRHYLVMARAQVWVDNYGMPRNLPKRSGTTYVQTWHGTPVKKLFFDAPKVQKLDAAGKAEYQALVDQWDFLVSPSPYFEETMVKSANFGGHLIRCGLPRNDDLVNHNTAEKVAEIRRSLELPEDRRILLFAPTYRAKGPGRQAYRHLDLPLLAKLLDEDWYLLRRGHYYRKPTPVGARARSFARDVSTALDVNDLLLASDALLTDFSSLMFDYALLRRPMLFYAPDLDYYSQVDPGTYVDIREVAPGPVLQTTEEVAEAVRRIDAVKAEYDDRYAEFRQRFCPLDDGRASEAVIRTVWGPGRLG